MVHIVETDDDAVRGLTEIVKHAAGTPLRVCLENTYDKSKNFHDSRRMLSTLGRVADNLAEESPEALSNLSTLLDVAHINLTKQAEDPVVAALKLAEFALELQRRHPQVNLSRFIAELHLNQNLGAISFFKGFSADIHSAVETPGPIFNGAVIAMLYSLGFTPASVAEQLGPLSENGRTLIAESVALGKETDFDAAVARGMKMIDPVFSKYPELFQTESHMRAYAFIAGTYGVKGTG